jgi:hypothetical protein
MCSSHRPEEGADSAALVLPSNDRRRLISALDTAQDAFWQSIAASYPEILTGDVDPFDEVEFQTHTHDAVLQWLRNNQRVDAG